MWGVLLEWLLGLAEVVGVIGAILLTGLVIAIAAFWTLSRLLALRGDPAAEFESEEYGPEGYRGAKVIPIRPQAEEWTGPLK